MDWNRLKIFHAVAEKGSFLGAAALLKISQSAVSRHIRYLEDHLQTLLVHRQSRGCILSESGEILHKTCQDIAIQLGFAQALLLDKQAIPKGTLKIYVPSDFGMVSLSICLARFIETHPEIRAEIFVDYTHRKKIDFRTIDVAIHTEPTFYAGLISVPLFKQPLKIYASHAYLKKFGVPFKPSHLDSHRLICFEGDGPAALPYYDYLLSLGANIQKPRTPFLSVNSILGMAQCVEQGLGISLLSPYIASTLKNVVQILPEVPVTVVEAYLTYPEKLRETLRLQAFQKFILQEFKTQTLFDEGEEEAHN